MSAPDKFLTDLAGLTEADSVRIDWRGYFDIEAMDAREAGK